MNKSDIVYTELITFKTHGKQTTYITGNINSSPGKPVDNKAICKYITYRETHCFPPSGKQDG